METILSQRLLEARHKTSRLTQQKVAELIGVSRSAIAQWESGSTTPEHENLVKAAEIYGVRIDWLLGQASAQKSISIDDACAISADQSGTVSADLNYNGSIDRGLMRSVASSLYDMLEQEKLKMEPADFADLLLTLHDWAVAERLAGRSIESDRLTWFLRVARTRGRG